MGRGGGRLEVGCKQGWDANRGGMQTGVGCEQISVHCEGTQEEGVATTFRPALVTALTLTVSLRWVRPPEPRPESMPPPESNREGTLGAGADKGIGA